MTEKWRKRIIRGPAEAKLRRKRARIKRFFRRLIEIIHIIAKKSKGE